MSNSPSLFYKFLGTLPRALTTIAISVTFIFHNFSVLCISFHWNLRDKSPRFSKTLPDIIVVFNSAVVWMVSILLRISNSSTLFSSLLRTILNTPTPIGINDTNKFHSFFNSLARSQDLSIFLRSFTLWSNETGKPTRWQFFFSLLLLSLYSDWIKWSIYIFKSWRNLYIYHLLVRRYFLFLYNSHWITFLKSRSYF